MKKKQSILLLFLMVSGFYSNAQNPKLESNKPTNNYPPSNLKIAIELKKDADAGLIAKFISNSAISKLVITSDDPNFIPHTTTFNLGTKTDQIKLDSPAYLGQSKYIFNFYVLRKSKPVWQSVIIRNYFKIIN
jgi:beta-glucanase (GH16 family)